MRRPPPGSEPASPVSRLCAVKRLTWRFPCFDGSTVERTGLAASARRKELLSLEQLRIVFDDATASRETRICAHGAMKAGAQKTCIAQIRILKSGIRKIG